MPKILRIANRFNLGGPTFNVAYLTKYLNSEFETLLVGGEKDETEAESTFILDQLGIEPVIIPEMRRSIHPAYDRIAYNKIKSLIKRFQPDIVHTHASKAGTLGRLAASSCKVPVVVHTFHGHVFHSYFNKVKTSIYKNIERYLALRSSRIIAVSDKQKKELSEVHKICDPDKIEVVSLGFDLMRFQENQVEKRKKFRQQFNIADDEIAIGIIGRLVPIKNHQLFIEAFDHVRKNSNKKVKAFIVGDGEEKENIASLARELNISFSNGQKPSNTDLIFTSWLKNIDEVNAGLDIIALTSLNEGTPVSLIEAQAANKPIVSTNVGGIENIVIPNETALLSEVHDSNLFHQNILKIIEDDELRDKMSHKGWDFVREKFHYTRLVQDTGSLYNRLLLEVH